MNPIAKYTLARLGIFIAVSAILLVIPMPVSPLIRIAAAIVISMAVSFFLLKKMRDEMGDHIGTVLQRRAAHKEQLRSALAGDDEANEIKRSDHRGDW